MIIVVKKLMPNFHFFSDSTTLSSPSKSIIPNDDKLSSQHMPTALPTAPLLNVLPLESTNPSPTKETVNSIESITTSNNNVESKEIPTMTSMNNNNIVFPTNPTNIETTDVPTTTAKHQMNEEENDVKLIAQSEKVNDNKMSNVHLPQQEMKGRAINFTSDNSHMSDDKSNKYNNNNNYNNSISVGHMDEKSTSEEPVNYVTTTTTSQITTTPPHTTIDTLMMMMTQKAIMSKEKEQHDKSKIFFNDDEDEDLSNISMDDDNMEHTESSGIYRELNGGKQFMSSKMNDSSIGCMMNGKTFKVGVIV
jgi:hypothetical protein